MDDRELLADYARNGSEQAFTTLVQRYVDLVYSTAARALRDPDQAKDATQAVFLILARKAGSISSSTVLSGWLYRTARYVAMAAARANQRRKLREHTMAELLTIESGDSAEAAWKQLSPHLDESMEKLSEPDRNAILLRFFQGKSTREVAESLGIGEEAAKKRVARAIDRLRNQLAVYGIRNSTVLAAALTAYAVQPAPAALAGLLPAALLSGTTAASSAHLLMEGTLNMIAWTKMKMTAACAGVLLLTAGTATVSVQNAQLAETHVRLKQALDQQQAQQQLLENADQQMIAELEIENRQLRERATELHRLRNEIGQLQQTRPGSSASMAAQIAAHPASLRPAAEVLRELQYEKFIAAGSNALAEAPLAEHEKLEYTDEIDLMKHVGLALRIHATDHADQFPERIEQLFGTGVLNETMERRLQDSRYEYLRFENAETKPNLPAVWWRAPDERGIRVLVFNDGSARLIREPAGVEPPGGLP